MPPKYTAPDPAEMTLLRACHHLRHPGQKSILDEFATGNIGVETTAYLLIEEAKERFPAYKAAREAEAFDRAERARELEEMAINETATEPKFVDYTPEGRPVIEPPKPLPAGYLVTDVLMPAVVIAKPTNTVLDAQPPTGVATTEVPAEEAPVEETAAAAATNAEATESSDEGAQEDDTNWLVGPATDSEEEQNYGDD